MKSIISLTTVFLVCTFLKNLKSVLRIKSITNGIVFYLLFQQYFIKIDFILRKYIEINAAFYTLSRTNKAPVS